MLEFLTSIDWAGVAQIIMIDILLGGDNAVVIALACRNLPPERRKAGILWGTAGAIILRVVLIAFAMSLLKMPYIKLVGGALLIWIGIKLLAPDHEEHEDGIEGSANLIGAIKTIIIADFIMSLDNVVAIAGAAEGAPHDQQLGLVIFGLLVSIPIIVWGSQIVLKLIDRYPLVITGGGALLGWIAGGMMISDSGITGYLPPLPSWASMASALVCAVLVVVVGKWLAAKKASQTSSAA